MPRRARRPVASRALVLAAPWLVAGCAAPSGPAAEAIADFTMRERVAGVRVGQSLAEAHAILGRDPVRRPGHPGDPFASPRRALALSTADGAAVRIEVYVVATRPADGCPDVHFEDVPVAYVDGFVAGTGWAWVERRWRAWGGSLQALRDAQDRHRCPVAPSAP